jgi:hypothetical protein
MATEVATSSVEGQIQVKIAELVRPTHRCPIPFS